MRVLLIFLILPWLVFAQDSLQKFLPVEGYDPIDEKNLSHEVINFGGDIRLRHYNFHQLLWTKVENDTKLRYIPVGKAKNGLCFVENANGFRLLSYFQVLPTYYDSIVPISETNYFYTVRTESNSVIKEIRHLSAPSFPICTGLNFYYPEKGKNTDEVLSDDNFAAEGFVVISKKDGSVNVVYNQTYIELGAEKLIIPPSKEIIFFKLKGKYGVVHLPTVTISPAKYSNIPDVVREFSFPYQYVKVNDSTYESFSGDLDINPTGKFYNPSRGKEETIGKFDENEDFHPTIPYGTYDYVYETELEGYYVVGKGKNCGLVDGYGNVLIPIEYTKLEIMSNPIPLQIYPYDITFICYAKKLPVAFYMIGKGFISPKNIQNIDYNEFIYDFGTRPLAKVYKNKNVGLYELGKGYLLPPIYKDLLISDTDLYVDAPVRFYVIGKGNKKLIINEAGDTVYPFEFNTLEGLYGTKLATAFSDQFYIFKGKKMGLFLNGSGKNHPPIYSLIETDYNNSLGERIEAGYVTYIDEKKGFIDDFGNLIYPSEMDELYLSVGMEKKYNWSPLVIIGEKQHKLYAAYVNPKHNSSKYTFSEDEYYDVVYGHFGYRLEGNGYESTDLRTLKKSLFSQPLEVKGEKYILFSQDGYFGAKSLEGEVLIEPIYISASFVHSDSFILRVFDGKSYDMLDVRTNF